MWKGIKSFFRMLGKTVVSIRAFLRSVIGSRMGMAVAAACLIAFGVQVLKDPTRLPPIGGVPLWQLGLGPAPPPIVLPEVKLPDFVSPQTQADIIAAAHKKAIESQRQAQKFALEWISEKPEFVRAANLIGLGLSILGLILATVLRTDYLRRTHPAYQPRARSQES